MKMATGVAGVLALVMGVAACVKLDWRVTLPGPGNYSVGTSVLVGADGKAYMAGYLSPEQLFVAAYSKSGSKLWEQIISGENFSPNGFGRALAQDGEGNLLLRWTETALFSNHLFKLDTDGNVVMDRVLESSRYLTNMEHADDGMLYFNSWIGEGVAAYTPEGELAWSYPEGADNTDGNRVLDQYDGLNSPMASVAAASGYRSSGGYHYYQGVGVAVLMNNRIVSGAERRITMLDNQGAVLNQLAAAELGLDTIYRVLAQGDNVLVVGALGSSNVALLLDAALDEITRTEMADAMLADLVAAAEDSGTCVAHRYAESGAGDYMTVVRLDAAGSILWQKDVSMDIGSWEYAEVSAANSSCFLTASIWTPEERLIT